MWHNGTLTGCGSLSPEIFLYDDWTARLTTVAVVSCAPGRALILVIQILDCGENNTDVCYSRSRHQVTQNIQSAAGRPGRVVSASGTEMGEYAHGTKTLTSKGD